ncbi:hypothetical protein CTRI78_v002997 [Colletotrichum trifolii]|uniref:Uncharacterized protein n=1 Tax=Colletotrichum trifolii TaxID=5466 RepID=A0A4R8RQ12_COLTR|nr:hypothetical protein CTRI78_v002997 [Colletotrichum trifolii]
MASFLCICLPSRLKTKGDKDGNAQPTVIDASNEPDIELVQLPAPVKLSDRNRELDWLAQNPTPGSIASSRSTVRSGNSSSWESSVASSNNRSGGAFGAVATRLKRQDRPLSPEEIKKHKLEIQRRRQVEKTKAENAAHREFLRRSSIARMQADLRSETRSTRSISTRGAPRLETVEENPLPEHTGSLHSCPRQGIEFAISNGESITGVDYESPPPPSPAVTVPAATLKYPRGASHARRRQGSSCPVPDAGLAAAASRNVARKRDSMPDMATSPTSDAPESTARDKDPYAIWQQTQRNSKTAPVSDTGDASASTASPLKANISGEASNFEALSIPVERDGTPRVAGTAAAPESSSAPGRPPTSSQSEDDSALENWLLADNLAINDESTSALALKPEYTVERPTGPRDSGVSGHAKPERTACDTDGDAECKEDAADPSVHEVMQSSEQQSAHAGLHAVDGITESPSSTVVPQYPTSSTYSSVQHTRQHSSTESKSTANKERGRDLAHTLTNLQTSPFTAARDLREEQTEDSYRTAVTQGAAIDDTVLASSSLISDRPSSSGESAISRHANCDDDDRPQVPDKPKDGRHGISSSPTSKFTERFEVSDTTMSPKPNAPRRRTSLLQGLLDRAASGAKGHGKSRSLPSVKPAPLSSSDDSRDASDRLGLAKKPSNMSLRSNVQSNIATENSPAPKLVGCTTEIWERAFQAELDQRDKSGASKSASSKIADLDATEKGSLRTEAVSPAKVADRDVLMLSSHAAQVKVTGEVGQQEDAGQTVLKPDQHTVNRKLATPPRSWARWSSQDRANRTGAEGMADNVTSKDFVAAEAQQSRVTDIAARQSGAEATPKSISKKLGKVVKSRIDKLVSPKPKEKGFAHLEHPELEALPSCEGHKDLTEFQGSIDNLLPTQRAKMVSNPALALADMEASRRSLNTPSSVRAPEIEHTGRGYPNRSKRDSRQVEANEPVTRAAHGRPFTPADLSGPQVADITTATTEPWATPASRLSDSPPPTNTHASKLNDEDRTAESSAGKKPV